MRGRENWGRQDRVHEKMCPEPEVFHNVQVKEAGEIKRLRFRTTQILKRKNPGQKSAAPDARCTYSEEKIHRFTD